MVLECLAFSAHSAAIPVVKYSFFGPVTLGTAKPWEQLRARQLLTGSPALPGQGEAAHPISCGLLFCDDPSQNQAQTSVGKAFTINQSGGGVSRVSAFPALLALSGVICQDTSLERALLFVALPADRLACLSSSFLKPPSAGLVHSDPSLSSELGCASFCPGLLRNLSVS